jgi:hypothetical protein
VFDLTPPWEQNEFQVVKLIGTSMKDVDGESVAHEGQGGWKTSGMVKAVFMAKRFWSPSIKDWTLAELGE